MKKLKCLLSWVPAIGLLLLAGCSVVPGTYEFTQTSTLFEDMPKSTSMAITPAVIDQLAAEERDRKAALNKQAMLNMKGLTGSTSCKGSSSGRRSTCQQDSSTAYVYRLGVGDKLLINVWGQPDLNLVGVASATNVTSPSASGAQRFVGSNGKLFFPLVGEIQAEGLTINQFRANLTRALSPFIKDPQIDVGIVGFQSQKVYVMGDVLRQGVYPITDIPLRITDLIGQAGLTPTSDLYGVILNRDGKNVSLDLYDLYYEGKSDEDVLLKHGDRVTVPDDKSRKIFIMGEVLAPRAYIMRRGKMTLTEVIMDAGGINQSTSAPNRIYVLRADKDGSPIIYQLHAGQPEGLVLGDRFVMKAHDFVFINPTDLAMIGRVIGQLFPFLSAGTTAAAAGAVGP